MKTPQLPALPGMTPLGIRPTPAPTPFNLDEFHSLDRAERDTLVGLVRTSVTFADGRKIPDAFHPLITKGLAFRAHGRISVTEKGLAVAERVA